MISPKHLDLFDREFLQVTIGHRMSSRGFSDREDYLLLAKEDPEEMGALTEALHIRYSEFFRNPLTFATLEKLVLPLIIRNHRQNANREIRIWSSACADGQESFSIAMILDELLHLTEEPFHYRIFASDISLFANGHGPESLFNAESLRNLPYRFLEKWFKRKGNFYRLDPGLKNQVVFTTFDLADEVTLCPPDCIYGDFDLILCCNVLYYYNAKTRNKMIRKLARCLTPGGYLITSETERDLIPRDLFREEFPDSAIFIKNDRL